MKKTKILLITLLGLMIASMGAMAQPGGLTPLVNSTHTYSVTPGDAGNSKAWSITQPSGYTIISGASTASVVIKWTTAGTYTLTYTETAPITLCKTVIEKTIVVSGNTFDVVTPATLAAICNEASGVPNYASSDVSTTVQFVVNMATGVSSWNPNWEFNFTLTPSNGTTISNVTSSAGTLTSGPYKVTGLSSASGVGTVTITLELTGGVNAAHTVDFAITSATELQYNTPSNNTGNKAATQTINGIPATTAFSAN